MSYSSESCMVSEKQAKQIRTREIINKERKEKLKKIFDAWQKVKKEAKG